MRAHYLRIELVIEESVESERSVMCIVVGAFVVLAVGIEVMMMARKKRR